MNDTSSYLGFFISHTIRALLASERHHHHKPHAPFVRIGMIQIIQTADIVYVQYLENIVNTHRAFHVRGLRVHHKAGRTSVTGREQEELAVTRMLHRIVLVG